MDEVIVRLVGGLGNQMFQYAAGRTVAKRNQSDLTLDLSWFGTDPEREYALNPFCISAKVINNHRPSIDTNPNWMRRISRGIRQKMNILGQEIPVFSERSFCYDSRIEAVQSPVILDGYFQSEKYFTTISTLISEDFSLHQDANGAAAEMLAFIRESDAICVHIRRGDYVTNALTNAYHGTCSMDYYHEGLNIVASGMKNPRCFVFSDEPQWVRENFNINIPITVIDLHGRQDAHEDLRLMRECRHFVIANSSLSWWAAWLSSSVEKKVVAPKAWFKNSKNDTADLIPDTWHQI